MKVYQGIYLRIQVLIRNIDEGSVLRVRTDDIFALPDYYSKLPALATRCSVGKLKTLLSDKEVSKIDNVSKKIFVR